MTVGDGALLPLSGILDNAGAILLQSTGSETDLELVQHGVTLQGGGTVTLSDSDGNVIFGSDPSVHPDQRVRQHDLGRRPSRRRAR